MRALLGVAAIAAFTMTSPALALDPSRSSGFGVASGGRVHVATPGLRGRPTADRLPRVHRSHGRFDGQGDFNDGFYYPAYYDGDYDANRSFDPDKWNDWWHERPERSFPRWVWRNQGCTEDRMWYSGAGWRCTP
ncbi:MAG: hypothetical protein ACJ8EH_07630 [Sphingomicrobium sp.]